MRLGIDPGTVNIGVAITNNDGGLIYSCVLSIKELNGIDKVVEEIIKLVEAHKVISCAIERFVPYKGVYSSAMEQIIMVIGATWYALKIRGIEPKMYRAIEWKPKLCKHLFKTIGFNNPSQSFDKVFSKAAAEAIIKGKVKTSHESDAIGLSYIWTTELK